MDNPFQSPSVISIGPGVLGLERGLQRAIGKINVITYVEIEAFIVANLIAGMEAGMVDAVPVWTDVKTFQAKPFRKKIHGLIAGYPCQPFSLAGERKGTEDPRHLYPFISGIIETTGPVWCWFENVSGHASMGFDEVYKDLRRMGYAVEAGIFTAEETGAPHERERLFILAISERFIRYTRRKRIRWETWTNINWGGKGSAVANTSSLSDERECRNISGPAGKIESIRDKWQRGGNGFEYCSEKMDNANSRRCQQPQQGIRIIPGISERCKTLAHSISTGQQMQRINGKPDETDYCRTFITGTKLEYSPINGLQGLQRNEYGKNNGTDEQRRQHKSGLYNGTNAATGNNQWPAGPGREQHDWEEKRTVESGMGSAINGYNFREDLLRAYGNSVVEQTAELAFINLLKKHIINFELIK